MASLTPTRGMRKYTFGMIGLVLYLAVAASLLYIGLTTLDAPDPTALGLMVLNLILGVTGIVGVFMAGNAAAHFAHPDQKD